MKKMRTVLAVVAALAVMATAMTGFAATVSTMTNYNKNEVYAGVTTTVSGASGEVTLLVKTTGNKGVNGSGILYIDQKTADGSDVVFDYTVVKENINNFETEVVLGTTGAAITQPTDGLGIVELNVIDGGGYTISFNEEAYGAGEAKNLNAAIVAEDGFEIEEIKIDGEVQELGLSWYSVNKDDLNKIDVKVKSADQTPEMVASEYEYGTEGEKHVGTAIIKINGDMTGYETGVIYSGNKYKALGDLNEHGYIAVQIKDAVEIGEGDLETYFEAIN